MCARVCVYSPDPSSSPYYKTLSDTSKRMGLLPLHPLERRRQSDKEGESWVELKLSGCCVCRTGGSDGGGERQKGGVVEEVCLNIFLSLCFAAFSVSMQAPT